MENKYNNGKIYKLICEDGHYYIGSTIQKLNLRFNHHKGSSKKSTSKVYTYINNIGWDKVKIELIEDYPCNTKSELNERVSVLIEESKNNIYCLNHKQNERNIIENIYNNGKIYKLKSTDDTIISVLQLHHYIKGLVVINIS
jgi:hypothetical protein